jgi:hypothetical protein
MSQLGDTEDVESMAAEVQLLAEALFVRRLHQPRAELPMHVNRRPNDRLSQPLKDQRSH